MTLIIFMDVWASETDEDKRGLQEMIERDERIGQGALIGRATSGALPDARYDALFAVTANIAGVTPAATA